LLRARDWQDRAEFEELCRWWRDGEAGVFALFGIGGAGKTAIADRFLQVLPAGLPEHPNLPKRTDLPPAAGLFVFSFYDEANPDNFFFHVAKWLEPQAGSPRREGLAKGPADQSELSKVSFQQTLDFLQKADPCLLILDGLEKVQYDGARGEALGGLSDGRLRELVLRVADGWLPNVRLLITSRFSLFDALSERATFYRQTEVTQLSLDAAVQLLRDRGVSKGTRAELAALARDHGLHALSVDLIGGYVAHFCGGDLSQLPPLGGVDVSDLDPSLHPRAAAVIEQERRFTRVASRITSRLQPTTLRRWRCSSVFVCSAWASMPTRWRRFSRVWARIRLRARTWRGYRRANWKKSFASFPECGSWKKTHLETLKVRPPISVFNPPTPFTRRCGMAS
jgi:hypothetical protein